MILYLYGPDSYRRREKLKIIAAKYQEKHSGLTIERFWLGQDGEGESEKFKDFTTSQSLFSAGKKLGICHIDQQIVLSGDFPAILKSLRDDQNIVLIIDAEKALPKEYNFLLKKPVLSQSFEELKPAQLAAFIKSEAQKRNLKISSEAVGALIKMHGGNTWGMVTELEKMALGSHLEDIQEIPNFFVLLNRAKKGDLPALTWLLETEEPAMVFNILAAQAPPEMKPRLADYDAAVKSGKLDYEEALLDLAIRG
jgi:DNA polymerase III delta subunit